MKYFAHSGTCDDLSDGEELKDHLQKVADKARSLAVLIAGEDSALARAAQVAGFLHDLGKYQPEWQQYLKDSAAKCPATSVPHAIHGAAYALHALRNNALGFVVAGHHAGLHDMGTLKEDVCKASVRDRVERLGQTLRDEFPSFPTSLGLPFSVPGGVGTALRRYEFWTRVLFSILIDADRLETERFYTGRHREPSRLDPVRMLDQLTAERVKRSAGKSGPLADVRNQVFDTCVAAGTGPQGFFELTVPTGGGKTLSGMAFALAHAKQHDLRRVIVVIPFLSIIEQNAHDYKTILGAENVIEHHSAVAEQEGSRGEPTRRTPAELATENWDAPVIVTTSVQFLETLLASSTRKCRKLHNIARSVVVFDEAQALPTHILNPLMSVFRELVEQYGTSIVFSTATQPAFRKGRGLTEGLKDELKPIIPGPLVKAAFQALRRVDYRVELAAPWEWDTLTNELVATTQALCVLNTRRHAREVWEALKVKVREKHGDEAAKGVLHLSSAMCAEHRTHVLGDKRKPEKGSVRDRLARNLPCWLVSTQVIEAGVDVDFPKVFRALGPLDSIVQAAGRCNREGRSPTKGEVVVFQPADEGMPRGLYQTATGEARHLLATLTSDQLASDPDVFARYFDTIYGRANCDAHGIQAERTKFQFRTVGELAKVISDGGTPVIVPYKTAKKWIARIQRQGTFDRFILRRLQRFTVNLRSYDIQQLRDWGLVRPLVSEDGPLVLEPSAYDDSLGVVLRGLSPEDFLQFDLKERS